jgi:hypothetical protein
VIRDLLDTITSDVLDTDSSLPTTDPPQSTLRNSGNNSTKVGSVRKLEPRTDVYPTSSTAASVAADLHLKRADAYPTTATVLADWYSARVHLIESQTAQPDLALALCRIGLSNISCQSPSGTLSAPPIKLLESLADELVTLSDLVYSCGETALDLDLLSLLTRQEVLESFLVPVFYAPEEFAW